MIVVAMIVSSLLAFTDTAAQSDRMIDAVRILLANRDSQHRSAASLLFVLFFMVISDLRGGYSPRWLVVIAFVHSAVLAVS
jgi:hypothetical protein|tara:strand:- start:213 stop:455 length:243 start_codon:yes stop_codon:yes gene_type:complete